MGSRIRARKKVRMSLRQPPARGGWPRTILLGGGSNSRKGTYFLRPEGLELPLKKELGAKKKKGLPSWEGRGGPQITQVNNDQKIIKGLKPAIPPQLRPKEEVTFWLERQ